MIDDWCNTCNGPARRTGDDTFEAMPDTLEDIKQAADGLSHGKFDWTLGNTINSYEHALTRLFEGCAVCGREPVFQLKVTRDRGVVGFGPMYGDLTDRLSRILDKNYRMGAWQAYEHAAQEAEDRVTQLGELEYHPPPPNKRWLNGGRDALGRLAETLRSWANKCKEQV